MMDTQLVIAKCMLALLVIMMAALVFWLGYLGLNDLGIKTTEGEAVVIGCTYKAPHTTPIVSGKVITRIRKPEQWLLQMQIGDKTDDLLVDKETCQVQPGTVYRVRYGTGRIDGKLLITGLVE